MMKRDEQIVIESRDWLYNIVTDKLNDAQILQGFVKYYVLYGQALANVRNEMMRHCNGFYDRDEILKVMDTLRRVLTDVAEGDNHVA